MDLFKLIGEGGRKYLPPLNDAIVEAVENSYAKLGIIKYEISIKLVDLAPQNMELAQLDQKESCTVVFKVQGDSENQVSTEIFIDGYLLEFSGRLRLFKCTPDDIIRAAIQQNTYNPSMEKYLESKTKSLD